MMEPVLKPLIIVSKCDTIPPSLSPYKTAILFTFILSSYLYLETESPKAVMGKRPTTFTFMIFRE